MASHITEDYHRSVRSRKLETGPTREFDTVQSHTVFGMKETPKEYTKPAKRRCSKWTGLLKVLSNSNKQKKKGG